MQGEWLPYIDLEYFIQVSSGATAVTTQRSTDCIREESQSCNRQVLLGKDMLSSESSEGLVT